MPLSRTSPVNLKDILARIQPQLIAKKGFSRPQDVQLLKGKDSDGEDALFVYLVFPDKTPDSELAWSKVEPMVSWVRDTVWSSADEEQWPYVRVKRASEITKQIG
ncbi:MAG TPA: hypothetical protein PK490_13445 [Prosthecobacter sp.]|nr:hypothetical protein [Prosthecobacter sp.]HRK15279.1 hypothetical protein [Prosthecobacter sp.]